MSTFQPEIAVLLSGCGVFDGAEVHESVMTLLALSRHGVAYQCFAPNRPQHHVVNHVTGQEDAAASRNVLVESARIARGDIKDLKDYAAADYDALMIPGGFGVAKNLCTFALDGAECRVDEDVRRALRETHAARKPIGALCISPALVTKILGSVTVTVGADGDAARGIAAMGGTHVVAAEGEIVLDEAACVVTTPCYMLEATVAQIADSAEAVLGAVLKMVADHAPSKHSGEHSGEH